MKQNVVVPEVTSEGLTFEDAHINVSIENVQGSVKDLIRQRKSYISTYPKRAYKLFVAWTWPTSERFKSEHARLRQYPIATHSVCAQRQLCSLNETTPTSGIVMNDEEQRTLITGI